MRYLYLGVLRCVLGVTYVVSILVSILFCLLAVRQCPSAGTWKKMDGRFCLIRQCLQQPVPVPLNSKKLVNFFWILRILNFLGRLLHERWSPCDFDRTSNYLGVRIVHIRIEREAPVTAFFSSTFIVCQNFVCSFDAQLAPITFVQPLVHDQAVTVLENPQWKTSSAAPWAIWMT